MSARYVIETWCPKEKRWVQDNVDYTDRCSAEKMAEYRADQAVARGEVASWQVKETSSPSETCHMYGGT